MKQCFSQTLQGGISLTKAVISAFKTVQTASTLFSYTNAAISGTISAIPGVSIALDAIQLIEAIYRTIKGGVYQYKMTTLLKKFYVDGSDISGLLGDDHITRDERRGVMALTSPLTRKNLSKISSFGYE